jgi:hypothetical protein
MSHYRQIFCCRSSTSIQLLVPSVPKEEKKQFIPLPWKIGEFVLKNVNKIDDFATYSSISNLRYAKDIRGFDPYDIFRQHLQTLGLDDFFVNKHLLKNRDSGDSGPTSDVNEAQTVQSCTKLYTSQGKGPSEKSVQSANTTPKSTTSRRIAPTAHHSNKETQFLQMEEEITTLLTLKLIVLTSFQWRRREKKMWGKRKSRKLRVRTWNLTLIRIP